MADSKVAAEVAEAEFDRWLESMDLVVKHDTSTMDADDRKGYEKHKRTIVVAIERGQGEVDDAGQFIFTTSTGTRLVFREPTGADMMAQDTSKSGHDVEKTNKILASMTGQAPKFFATMPARDHRVCSAVFVLFLA